MRDIFRDRRVLIAFQIAAVVASAWFVASQRGQRVYTGSGDLALHYDLAHYVSQTWKWPVTGKTLISGMDYYPPLSHSVAAVIGLAYHSTLMGLNVTATLSLFGCYLLLARGVSVGSAAGSAIALVLTAAGVAFGRTQRAVEGFEILSNYFYAQLVGEFVVLAFVTWLCVTGRDWKLRLLASAVATYVCGALYAIAAVEIAMAYVFLEFFLLTRAAIAEQKLPVQPHRLAPMLFGIVILPILIIINPFFKGMLIIAGNNGGLCAKMFDHLASPLAAVLLVLSLALAILAPENLRWRRGTLFLATAGCATGAATLIQLAAWKLFHAGSEYAVKKYVFSVVTLLIFCIGAAAATLLERRREGWRSPALAVFASCLFGVAATLLMPLWAPVRLDRFVKYERYMMSVLGGPGIPADAFGRTVSRDHAFNWPLNHAAAFVDLGMNPGTSIAISTRPDLDFTEKDMATYAFIDDAKHAIPKSCLIPTRPFNDVVLVSVSCYKDVVQPFALGFTLELASEDQLPRAFVSGWSGKEASGVWSDGSRATLALHVDNAPDQLEMSIEAASFIANKDYVQHVPVYVGGKQVALWTFDAKTPAGTKTVSVPRALMPNGDLKVEFRFPDAISSADLKLSSDIRKMAIFVHSVTVSGVYEVEPIRPGQTIDLSAVKTLPRFFVNGWSGKEATGVWSDGPKAQISMHFDPAPEDPRISFEAMGFLPRKDYVQRVLVSIRGEPVAAWTFNAAKASGVYALSIPRRLIKNGNARLDFSFPDATSGVDQKTSGDPRHMAFFVHAFTIGR